MFHDICSGAMDIYSYIYIQICQFGIILKLATLTSVANNISRGKDGLFDDND